MSPIGLFRTSLAKKFVMAITGIILVGFVLGHMLGNLQVFGPPEAINEYAYFLHHILPWEILWVVRIVLLAAVVLHIVSAVMLVIENRRARPETYEKQKYMQASFAARTMKYSGLIVLAFIIFHLMHFTVQNIDPAFHNLRYDLDGKDTQDAYAMIILGFSNVWVSGFYIIAMGLLCWHLSHGVSSMFQSLGFRNEIWRRRLNCIALAFGLLIFAGFSIIPITSMISWYGGPDIVYGSEVRQATENWNGETPIHVTYPDSAHH
ncbi:succinate dehydrogenase cytochrome b subunit [Puniceicoccus vermicola]|uniref:Succinate dehydrogenase cytochrome b subunit n=1 Tax=Puniceicoccus vermicola TaxID=388746 RepID=A0A7X1B2D9_9BACT|nr:succinate dehydrogenase cytochrome b subunit [Puniceicoccus vermicola]MBC2604262.1 succinate dehydrogenase cytochrome b subunit [Puniceicoccus vermicola]